MFNARTFFYFGSLDVIIVEFIDTYVWVCLRGKIYDLVIMEECFDDNSVRINYIKVHEERNLPCSRTKSDLSGIRWYVIAVVSLAAVLNNFLWATWGPISQSAYLVYDWTENQLFWIVNIGNITGFLSVLLGVYLVDSSGKYQFL